MFNDSSLSRDRKMNGNSKYNAIYLLWNIKQPLFKWNLSIPWWRDTWLETCLSPFQANREKGGLLICGYISLKNKRATLTNPETFVSPAKSQRSLLVRNIVSTHIIHTYIKLYDVLRAKSAFNRNPRCVDKLRVQRHRCVFDIFFSHQCIALLYL